MFQPPAMVTVVSHTLQSKSKHRQKVDKKYDIKNITLATFALYSLRQARVQCYIEDWEWMKCFLVCTGLKMVFVM